MNRILTSILVCGIIGSCGLLPGCRSTSPESVSSAESAVPRVREPKVREPMVAGTFYRADPQALRRQVEQFLKAAKLHETKGELVALIAPHAGYDYSGPVAGYAYRQIAGKQFDDVVIIGPSHRARFPGWALCDDNAWRTPLGEVAIDKSLNQQIGASLSAHILPAVHAGEHSIEVQLPFLQCALKQFQIVPILMFDFSQENCQSLADTLVQCLSGKRALLIASTDMSHYPKYEDACRVDRLILQAIETQNPVKVQSEGRNLMRKGITNLHCTLCGEGPVLTVMMAAQKLGASQVEVLRYANSGDTDAGTKDRVVGYCAVAFYRKPGWKPQPEQESEAEWRLTPKQQERLLALARNSIATYLKEENRLQVAESDPLLRQKAGAFVTLKKHGLLRGCIGRLQAVTPLYITVRDMAIAAATEDQRFEPVTLSELKEIEIEVSVLTPPRKISDAAEIEVGTHGVIVRSGRNFGVFLPQVGPEQGWNREQLLNHLCADKAGLPADAWKKGAELFVFQALVFHEPQKEISK